MPRSQAPVEILVNYAVLCITAIVIGSEFHQFMASCAHVNFTAAESVFDSSRYLVRRSIVKLPTKTA